MVEKNTDASWAAKNDGSMSRGVAMLCVCVFVCVWRTFMYQAINKTMPEFNYYNPGIRHMQTPS